MVQLSPEYWNTIEGRIIKAIVENDNPISWADLAEKTQLDTYSLKDGLSALFFEKEISKDDGKYSLIDNKSKEEYQKALSLHSKESNQPISIALVSCQERSKEETLVQWLTTWKTIKELNFSLENKHFFLDGVYVDELTKDMIKLSKKSVLIANPFIESCYLTEALIQAKEKGNEVKIVTRSPSGSRAEQKAICHLDLKNHGIIIKYNQQIHSKIVTVDNQIAIISSMNFYSGSSGGASFEAGVVSIDDQVVEEASRYVERLLQRPNPKEKQVGIMIQADEAISQTSVFESEIPKIKSKPLRAGLKWTDEEDQELKKSYQEGSGITELAKKHQRKRGAITARLVHLGLMEGGYFPFRNKKQK